MYGKTECWLVFGDPPTPSPATGVSKTSGVTERIVGKTIHCPPFHQWLASKRAHLQIVLDELTADGFTVTAVHQFPKQDWLQLKIRWPLTAGEKSGYDWQ
tara:strand:- start:465 stop:764 length:300 start_codon:yes stop_codon:yes gene_type:complete